MPDTAASSNASRLIRRLEAGEAQTLVVYGTSLTEGGAWVGQIRQWLEERYPGQLTLINSGKGGRASRTGLNLLRERVLEKQPDTVILEFATNDAFRAYTPDDVDYDISPAESMANLNAMIDALLEGHPDREVIVQTMNPAWDAPNGNASGTKRPELERYMEGYRAVAKARGLRLLDHWVNWQALRERDPGAFAAYVPDGVHTNEAGYAAVVTPAILAALLGSH